MNSGASIFEVQIMYTDVSTIEEYAIINNLVDEYNYYEDQTNKTLIEILLQLFSPIFLVLSLAYQFVKWIEERYTINQRNCYEQHNK
jgi:hypothetical protein